LDLVPFTDTGPKETQLSYNSVAIPESAPPLAPSVKSASVADLVLDAREGHIEAWEELVGRFGGMIAATGRRYRLTTSDVAELQQTTWLRLVENLHRLEQPERVGGWLVHPRRNNMDVVRMRQNA
jgi:hypothetical protein